MSGTALVSSARLLHTAPASNLRSVWQSRKGVSGVGLVSVHRGWKAGSSALRLSTCKPGFSLRAKSSSNTDPQPSSSGRDGDIRTEDTTSSISTNVWDYKPWWCKPWSIVTTGSLIVFLVNQITGHSWFWTGTSSLPVLVWWYIFLYVYPMQFERYVAAENTTRQDLRQ